MCLYTDIQIKTISQRNYANDLIYATGILLRLSFQLTLQMQLEWHLKSLPIFRIDFEKIQENVHRFAFIECVKFIIGVISFE